MLNINYVYIHRIVHLSSLSSSKNVKRSRSKDLFLVSLGHDGYEMECLQSFEEEYWMQDAVLCNTLL